MPTAAPATQQREVVSTLAFCTVCLALIVALAVLPARTWWSQHQSLRSMEERRAELLYERAQLEARLEILETDSEIVRLARANYDLVFPGEESFRILPSPLQDDESSGDTDP
ncbi:MAG: FtsB family cell division protein [Acidimicrobiales bacterium]